MCSSPYTYSARCRGAHCARCVRHVHTAHTAQSIKNELSIARRYAWLGSCKAQRSVRQQSAQPAAEPPNSCGSRPWETVGTRLVRRMPRKWHLRRTKSISNAPFHTVRESVKEQHGSFPDSSSAAHETWLVRSFHLRSTPVRWGGTLVRDWTFLETGSTCRLR